MYLERILLGVGEGHEQILTTVIAVRDSPYTI